ncbi:glucose dehydrogenase [FAD, quinone]-like [Uloborus diversus]|uniref:glucose dehydrogenase [FAD, quinone]-like n=1 Tax=Uloborus diversus TaxID=327109 RepID=UPI00240A907F|nr:glucose dehydrogenase [FAD, quinone]-like [Uloborus diversus]
MSTAGAIDNARELSYITPFNTSPLFPLLLLSLTSQRHTPRVKTRFRSEYDYIIVGAGSAGAVVASRLSEVACVSVLLLEAGNSPPILSEIPAIARSFVGSDIDWKYRTTPQRNTAAGHINRQVTWPSGKTLGGSSTINAMLYPRGNRQNYDDWAAQGAVGWSYEEVLPYFKKLEDYVDPIYFENGFHNIGGPVTASKPLFNPVQKIAGIQAALNLGKGFVDSNGPYQSGFFNFDASIRRGQRCSTAKAYLVPSENRTNLDIVTNALVTKITIQNKRATGVQFDFNGRTRRVRARREVILSAGTTNTVQLLMLSGIGPLSELAKFDITCIADLPVGLNMQDHIVSFLGYELDDSLRRLQQSTEDDQNISNYINKREGPLTSAEGFLLMSFLRKNNAEPRFDTPDFSAYLIDPLAITLLQLRLKPNVLLQYFGPYVNKTTILCASQILHPISTGTVTIRSRNPRAPVVIDPNYFADFRDLDDVVQGLKFCNRFMADPAMKRIGARPFTSIIPGCEPYVNDEDLYVRCAVRTFTITANHQVGTAKMGDPNDPSTVVDPQLRVKTIRGLRVVDASVMPTIPWANTNAPTIMVAEKASDMIKSTISCRYSELR